MNIDIKSKIAASEWNMISPKPYSGALKNYRIGVLEQNISTSWVPVVLSSFMVVEIC